MKKSQNQPSLKGKILPGGEERQPAPGGRKCACCKHKSDRQSLSPPRNGILKDPTDEVDECKTKCKKDRVKIRRYQPELESLGEESSTDSSSRSRNLMTFGQILRSARKEVNHALKNHKIFTLYGPYHRVRLALRDRGWVEKFDSSQSDDLILSSIRSSLSEPPKHGRKSDHNSSTTTPAASSSCQCSKRFAINSHKHTHDDSTTVSSSGGQTTTTSSDVTSKSDPSKTGEDRRKHACSVPPKKERNGYYNLMSRLVRSTPPDLIWCTRRGQVDYPGLLRDQLINQHPSAPFTTKFGLARHFSEKPRYKGSNPEKFYPRCYVLDNSEDEKAFFDDYNLTACVSMVKLVVIANDEQMKAILDDIGRSDESTGEDSSSQNCSDLDSVDCYKSNYSCSNVGAKMLLTTNAAVHSAKLAPVQPSLARRKPLEQFSGDSAFKISEGLEADPDEAESSFTMADAIEMAIDRCRFFLFNVEPMSNLEPAPIERCWPWNDFLARYHQAVKKPDQLKAFKSLVVVCRHLCTRLRNQLPQFDMDGHRSIWIVKPGAKSRGRGIVICSSWHEICSLAHSPTSPSSSLDGQPCVVQKYIETPLLIHQTKFDIRQWFLVTSWAPLTIWWYRDCYLRFCSQLFTLDDFNESIHLSNNAIQCKYTNCERSKELPEENMWTRDQFLTWLSTQGKMQCWSESILPVMKRSIINAMLRSQDKIEFRKNSFGLYGADFMLTEDYRVWLIEINSSPCMAPTTSVTASMTTNVLEDTLKVVLDRRVKSDCSTGQFDLLYRQKHCPPIKLIADMLDEMGADEQQIELDDSSDGLESKVSLVSCNAATQIGASISVTRLKCGLIEGPKSSLGLSDRLDGRSKLVKVGKNCHNRPTRRPISVCSDNSGTLTRFEQRRIKSRQHLYAPSLSNHTKSNLDVDRFRSNSSSPVITQDDLLADQCSQLSRSISARSGSSISVTSNRSFLYRRPGLNKTVTCKGKIHVNQNNNVCTKTVDDLLRSNVGTPVPCALKV